MWKLWSLALGEKVGKNNKESDKIAVIRTILFMTYFITNCFIIFGVSRTHIFPVGQQPVKCIINK